MGPMLVFFTLFWLIPSALSWDPPQIQLPTYTYQCMPMELRWSLGSPPYSLWFYDYGRAAGQPVPGLGAWHNLTGYNYLVPCQAPAGASLGIALRDSTGWISIAGSFLVLPSGNSSCLTSTTNDADLSASQGTLSTIMWKFQQSVISAISVSATATPTIQLITSIATLPVQSASSRSVEPIATAIMEYHRSSNPLRIVIPVLASLFVVAILIVLGICLVRRRRRQPQKVKPRHPLASTSGVDLMDGESVHMMASIERNEGPVQPMQPVREQGVTEPPTREVDLTGTRAIIPQRQMRLHEAWPSTVKNRLSEVPAVPTENEPEPRAESSPTTTQNDTQPQIQTQPQTQPQTLEQRAEQLSAPELERLAALVARRLDRVRGAPPQYEATEGVGV